MTRNAVVVQGDTPLGVAARLLLRHEVRQVPVVDENGIFHGVLQDANMFRRGRLVGPDLDTWLSYVPSDGARVAADVMMSADVALSPDDDALRTLAKLFEARVPVAVVLEENVVVGVITEHDALRMAVRWLPEALSIDEQFSAPIATVSPLTTPEAAWDTMVAWGIRHLLIVDRHRKVQGVISNRDLAMNWGAPSVMDLCTSETLQAVPTGSRFIDAARTMEKLHIGCLPVVDEEDRAVGILTRRDVVRALVLYLEGEVDRINAAATP
jgi:CBS domain-containing protein